MHFKKYIAYIIFVNFILTKIALSCGSQPFFDPTVQHNIWKPTPFHTGHNISSIAAVIDKAYFLTFFS